MAFRLIIFVLVGIHSLSFGEQDWSQSISRRSHHPNKQTSINRAKSLVHQASISWEALCKSNDGKYEIKYSVTRCWKTLPAPGFPDEHVCTVRGDITCKFNPLAAGDLVEVLSDSKLFAGTQVIGEVKKGDVYRISRIEGEWVNLETLDGENLKGWIRAKNLSATKPAPPAGQ